jgi:2-desacetyl-2-hydroxyethyl bacteriochlorophyllide A dehydrogenase
MQELPDQALSLWVTGPRCAELRREQLAAPRPGQVLVTARYSAISRGTERLVFEGRVPASEYQRMRAPLQAGDFPFPVKYGYASVGRVAWGPAALLGRDVFCLHPHQSAYLVAEEQVLPLPEQVPAARAVLAANMETALNAIWDAELRAGDRVCVVGAGVLGCLVAYLAARHPGTTVTVVDVDVRKGPTVERLGAAFALPPAAPEECDVVLHASGAPAGLNTALAAAGLEARVIELSWFGDRRVELPLGAAFHPRRLSLCSSQVGRLPPAQAARWSHRRRLSMALSLLADPLLDGLISAETPFARAPEALAELSAEDGFELCRRLVYDSI